MTGSKTVWKFPVALTPGPQRIALPSPADKPVLFGEQDGNLYVWWEVRPGQSVVTRRVQVVGTGQDIPGDWRERWDHVGSLQQGAYVWHLYAA